MPGVPWLVAGGAVATVAVAGAAAAYLLLVREAAPPAGACEQSVRLREAGFTERLIELVCTTTTEYVGTENGRFRYVQTAPALNLRRDLLVSVEPDRTAATRGGSMLTTARGEGIYPLRVEVRPFDGGFHLIESYFMPYDQMHAETRQALGLNRQGRAPSSTHLISTHRSSRPSYRAPTSQP